MFGLAITLFFCVTGITLNHPDWFFGDEPSIVTTEGSLTKPVWDDLRDLKSTTAQRRVVEYLRATHELKGSAKDFFVDDFQSVVGFAAPGYSADVFIDMETGGYEVTQEQPGWVAVINDLHKGRDSGPIWSAVIDISAILLTLISASGLLLLLWIRRKRIKGLVVMVVGTIVLYAAYWVAIESLSTS